MTPVGLFGVLKMTALVLAVMAASRRFKSGWKVSGSVFTTTILPS